MDAKSLRPLSLGEVLDVSFGVYRQLFAPLFFVALLTQTVPLLLSVYVEATGGRASNLALSLVSLVLSMVASAIAIAASTIIISDSYLGHHTDAKDALRRASPFIGRLIGIAMMTGLVLGLLAMITVVPAVFIARGMGAAGLLLIPVLAVVMLYVLAGFAVSSQAQVIEATPRADLAMSRSWSLTKGYRGKVFAAMFVAALLLYLPILALGLTVGAGMLASGGVGTGFAAGAVVVAAIGALLQVLVYPFLYVVSTVLYYDLRVRKEGFDLELLASSIQGTG